MEYNKDLRATLDRHMSMGTWWVLDKGSQMEIGGVLRATGVKVHISGLRENVLETMEGLIRAMVATERLPADPPT